MKKLRPPVKTHGGKFPLCTWIIDHFPADYQNLTYCELCCGGASVMLNKAPSTEEVINDRDKGVVSIFKSLRDEPKEFIDRVKKIPYTLDVFESAQEDSKANIADYLDRAINEYVLRRMSRGGMKKTFAWSDRKRGGKPGDVNAWETMPRQLTLIADRVKRAIILNQEFKEVAKIWDDEHALVYLDPPYLPETRTASDVYDNEMSVDDHIGLLNYARDGRSKIVISGYASPLYNKHLKEWRSEKKEVPNHAGQGRNKERRTECIWMNY